MDPYQLLCFLTSIHNFHSEDLHNWSEISSAIQFELEQERKYVTSKPLFQWTPSLFSLPTPIYSMIYILCDSLDTSA